MTPLADALGRRRAGGIAAAGAVARDPARRRAEYGFSADAAARRARGGTTPTTSSCSSYLHLYALNRGVLLTPFHNMALMCPATTAADVDRHTEAFAAAAADLTG